jgi:hypothetical protein
MSSSAGATFTSAVLISADAELGEVLERPATTGVQPSAGGTKVCTGVEEYAPAVITAPELTGSASAQASQDDVRKTEKFLA